MEELELSQVAMEVILNAGDGRGYIEEAITCLAELDFDGAEERLSAAEEKILCAHRVQTETIQRQAAGEDVAYSLLFTHAQDTLMTVSSELHLLKKMIPLFKTLAASNKED